MLTDITVHFRCPINSVWMAAMNRGTIKSQGEKCNVPHLSKRPDSKSPLSQMVNTHQPDQEKNCEVQPLRCTFMQHIDRYTYAYQTWYTLLTIFCL